MSNENVNGPILHNVNQKKERLEKSAEIYVVPYALYSFLLFLTLSYSFLKVKGFLTRVNQLQLLLDLCPLNGASVTTRSPFTLIGEKMRGRERRGTGIYFFDNSKPKTKDPVHIPFFISYNNISGASQTQPHPSLSLSLSHPLQSQGRSPIFYTVDISKDLDF